ncbi:MAG TPA: outer membrane protein assembly factor BamD [Vicinamibacterales bacterium]|nr:outer membrane protein assembly factor BamD [Vicinamibacterales bacterium]
MTLRTVPLRACGLLVAALAILLTAPGCGSKQNIPVGITEADKFLFEQGTKALNEKKWFTARQYFMRLMDTYPQSPHRPDAKLGIGDSYLGENTTESLAMAANEFSEFLGYFPTHPRADYAQYKLGYVHYVRMRSPARDQTETKAAIAQWEIFVERYPNSPLMPEVRAKLREARDRLSESEYQVGLFYYRQKWYPAAIDRFKDLLKADPLFTRRDAVYYHLGESLVKMNAPAEALPYFDRLIREFEASEYLEKARMRLAELKSLAPDGNAPAEAQAPATASPSGTDGQPAATDGQPASAPSAPNVRAVGQTP